MSVSAINATPDKASKCTPALLSHLTSQLLDLEEAKRLSLARLQRRPEAILSVSRADGRAGKAASLALG
jgi:hypothetical protein